jgi:hypothetical protein
MVSRKSVGRAWAMPTSSETFGLAPVASNRQAAESRMRSVMCSSRSSLEVIEAVSARTTRSGVSASSSAFSRS